MSDTHDPQNASPGPPAAPEPLPPYVIPVRYALPPGGRPAVSQGSTLAGTLLRTFLILALGLSIGLNLIFLFYLQLGSSFKEGRTNRGVVESYHSGQSDAHDKIAIIHVDGVILEGANSFVHRQIAQAAEDSQVKAVVLRINSPGGTISGSDDLYHRLLELRDGTHLHQKGGPKPIFVSMGPVAASGGYYIAMPGEYLVAETTTITGSIGVYAAFPNISDLAKNHGISMDIIKAGDIKDAGSMFHKMTPQERQLWQDLVDNAYRRFLEVVETGRPKLKGKMMEVVLQKDIPDRDAQGNCKRDENGQEKTVKYVRKRADGGIWTAQEAKEYGLIDEIGYLETVIQKAAEKLGVSEYRVVTYERPPSLSNLLFGAEAAKSVSVLDADQLSQGAMPRLWYLAPQAELAGFFAAIGRP